MALVAPSRRNVVDKKVSKLVAAFVVGCGSDIRVPLRRSDREGSATIQCGDRVWLRIRLERTQPPSRRYSEGIARVDRNPGQS
jgi:hypothetical protein